MEYKLSFNNPILSGEMSWEGPWMVKAEISIIYGKFCPTAQQLLLVTD